MVSTNNLKNGMTVKIDGKLWKIDYFQHVKPGKGGAFVRTTLKSVPDGKTVDRTFRAGEDLEQAIVTRTELQYLYQDGENYVFMDTSTYEQTFVPGEVVAEAMKWTKESDVIELTFHEGQVIDFTLPANVELEIAETEPGVAGNTVSGASKPATLETGAVVQVPLFVNIGDRVKVDTRSGEYLSRA
ncbi:elongation factor P [Euzebya sp.]|uniref:elongation factor P n=1 Tax=Euzebya sp. TaxID=1971409 RepID=UPI003512914D